MVCSVFGAKNAPAHKLSHSLRCTRFAVCAYGERSFSCSAPLVLEGSAWQCDGQFNRCACESLRPLFGAKNACVPQPAATKASAVARRPPDCRWRASGPETDAPGFALVCQLRANNCAECKCASCCVAATFEQFARRA